jgi:hypothetical protein
MLCLYSILIVIPKTVAQEPPLQGDWYVGLDTSPVTEGETITLTSSLAYFTFIKTNGTQYENFITCTVMQDSITLVTLSYVSPGKWTGQFEFLNQGTYNILLHAYDSYTGTSVDVHVTIIQPYPYVPPPPVTGGPLVLLITDPYGMYVPGTYEITGPNGWYKNGTMDIVLQNGAASTTWGEVPFGTYYITTAYKGQTQKYTVSITEDSPVAYVKSIFGQKVPARRTTDDVYEWGKKPSWTSEKPSSSEGIHYTAGMWLVARNFNFCWDVARLESLVTYVDTTPIPLNKQYWEANITSLFTEAFLKHLEVKAPMTHPAGEDYLIPYYFRFRFLGITYVNGPEIHQRLFGKTYSSYVGSAYTINVEELVFQVGHFGVGYVEPVIFCVEDLAWGSWVGLQPEGWPLPNIYPDFCSGLAFYDLSALEGVSDIEEPPNLTPSPPSLMQLISANILPIAIVVTTVIVAIGIRKLKKR